MATPLGITDGGTGATTAAQALVNLGAGSFNVAGAPSAVTGNQMASDAFLARAFGVTADGNTDDTAALQALFNNWVSTSNGAALVLPDGNYVISGPITVTVPQDKSFVLCSAGIHGARFRVSGTFTDTVLKISQTQPSSVARGGTVHVSNITFVRVGAAGGFGISFNASTAGELSPVPGCVIENCHFENQDGGAWAGGISLFAANLARVRRCSGMGMATASTFLTIDSNNLICVDTDVDDLYVNGTGAAVQVGHTGGSTALIQGITFRRPSFTGCKSGITWVSSGTGSYTADELIVSDAQINTSGGPGIYTRGVNTVVLTGSYLLKCQTAVDVGSCAGRVNIGNNVFLAGAGHNGIVLTDCGTGTDGGNVVTGNVFSFFGVSPAAVTLNGATDNTLVAGNICSSQACVADQSSGVNNALGPNLDTTGLRFQTLVKMTDLNLSGTGASNMSGAWSTTTGSVSASSATISAPPATIRYKKFGRTVYFNCNINITNSNIASGTPGASINLALPFTNNNSMTSYLSGRETAVTGKALNGSIPAGSNTLLIYNYDGTYPGANNATLTLSGLYEATS